MVNYACHAFECTNEFPAGRSALRSVQLSPQAPHWLPGCLAHHDHFPGLRRLRRRLEPSSGYTLNPLPSVPAESLIAWWRFDEPSGDVCTDASGNGHEASLDLGRGEGLHRVEGLFGSALSLSGRHLIRVSGPLYFGGRQKLSFSAWVKPSAFERYSEIFRKEDGEQRVLFSFQDNGTVLSLGLNVGGYVECRCQDRPARGARRPVAPLRRHVRRPVDAGLSRWQRDRRAGAAGHRSRAGGAAPGCIGSVQRRRVFSGRAGRPADLRRALTADGGRRAVPQRPDGLEQFAANDRRTAGVGSTAGEVVRRDARSLAAKTPSEQGHCGCRPPDRGRRGGGALKQRDFREDYERFHAL